MPLLPAVVPDIPESRADVAAARLARKVGPLFGVPWPDGPFEGRTWVCDYARITLSEIARGAPLPSREQAARFGTPPVGAWDLVERVGVAGPRAALPNEIANATLNRYGPDTRAAVVLTAVNRLLDPVKDAVEAAMTLLADGTGAPLPARLRLAAWAGLVIEVFRSQPALMAAGIHARAIQHELVQAWELPLAIGLGDLPLTRCEVRPTAAPAPAQPSTLDVADLTFAALHLTPVEPDDDANGTPPALAARLHDAKSVDLLLRRLLAAGTAADTSYLWLSERAPGQLAVEALMPPTGIVERFVRQSQPFLTTADPAADPALTLPAVPDAALLSELPMLARRAALIALLTVLRHIQDTPAGRDGTRREIVPVLAGVADLARACLDPDDPVAALTACRVADMTVQTLRPDTREDLRGPVSALLAGLDRCEDLLRCGLLDRGAAAEAISSACVEINAVARTNVRLPGVELPDAHALTRRLRRSWQTYHEALQIPPFRADVEVPRPPGLAGFHLQNYAAFLAGSATTTAETEEAVALFRGLVIPARADYVARTDHFRPLQNTLQVASRATTRLAERARDADDAASAARWAGLGREWILRALAAEETRRLVSAERPSESAARFALLAAPALLVAAEVGVPDARADIPLAVELIDLVRRWEAGNVGAGTHHARHDEVVALSARASRLGDPVVRHEGSVGGGAPPSTPDA